MPRVSTGQGRAGQTPGALEAVVCTTKTMGECLHRFFAVLPKKGSRGLDRDGPTHKLNMSIFFHYSIHIQQQESLRSFLKQEELFPYERVSFCRMGQGVISLI